MSEIPFNSQELETRWQRVQSKISQGETLEKEDFCALFWHETFHSTTRLEQEYKNELPHR